MSSEAIELAQAAAQGDEKALHALLARFLPDVRAFVRMRAGAALREHESCSDLVQSVCREILQHGSRFKHPDEDAFRRWLFTTALRKLKNRQRFWTAQRRDVRRETADTREAVDGALLQSYAGFASPSRQAILREEVERIEGAFSRLSEEHREVISLAHIAGLSRARIAQQMDRSEEAVRSLLHRAVVSLSRELTGGGRAPE